MTTATTMQGNAIRITASVRELFKLMNFHEIPEEAKFVVFLEDGDATFTDEEIGDPFDFGSVFIIHVHTDITVEFEEGVL